MDVSTILYTWVGHAAVGYRVVGDGPVDCIHRIPLRRVPTARDGVPDRWRLYRVVNR